ncbi:endonuclease/exonuclease/phosphatase family protein [Pedobacter aquatilis]|uniref:endonuclease/exonuclease/phosphatase family protein n=1 Tax=Pedobacter aquatilis TaxID=351343 RepID=UPI0025B62518|nr:endonuclease/exonuclease/phosphatase family protein [Pedobacter aquatilis]MDN3588817.1 endonuclease/exonuclease/phosphatase family protein [Pedobacter aquatilis]
MKIKLIVANTMLFFATLTVEAQQITIGTFNIRYDNPMDSGNLWVERAPVVSNLIRFHKFDILGVQEALKNQLKDIGSRLPEYDVYGKGRDDGKDGGEHSAILFKKDRFKLIKSGDFWLSETPDKPSKGWDVTCCNRICSWVYLQDLKTNKQLYVFNVHYDHQGKVARQESSKLILLKIAEIAGSIPTLLTGDFNGGRDSEWYQRLATSGKVTDVYSKVKFPYANNSSANGFKMPKGQTVIDHIFMTNQFSASRWGILTDTYYGKFPSDHFPVLAEVELK